MRNSRHESPPHEELKQPGELRLFPQGLVTLGKTRMSGHPHHISPPNDPEERAQRGVWVAGQGTHLPCSGNRVGTPTVRDSGVQPRG